MKPKLLFIVFCILLFVVPAYGHNDSIYNMILKYDSLKLLFIEDMRSKHIDSEVNLNLNSSNDILRSSSSFSENLLYVITKSLIQNTIINNILIVVEERVNQFLFPYIERYAHDIFNAYGCGVKIFSVSGGDHEDIKNLILDNSNNLSGVVFVGNIPTALFYQDTIVLENGKIEEADTWPCDLYYMDLDGTWVYTSEEDAFCQHIGSNTAPEIFVGRISAHKFFLHEEEYLINFFNRDHNYWMGYKQLNKKYALTFTEQDWNESTYWNSVRPLYGNNNYDIVKADQFTIPNYKSHLEDSKYEFIQLACHSDPYHHYFILGIDSTILTADVLRNTFIKKAIGYNLYCCSACRWTENPNIGNSYIFGDKTEGLAVVGSTKKGSMLGFNTFYSSLHNAPMGSALKNWFNDYVYDLWFQIALPANQRKIRERLISWHYGMCILGDPLVSFHYESNCDDEMVLNSGVETGNAAYYAENKIKVQNYSIPNGKNVIMGAPRIEITGPFVCSAGASLTATVDGCVCYNPNPRNNIGRHMMQANESSNTKENKVDYFTCFPNPAKTIINIEYSEKLEKVYIYALSSRPVLQTTDTEINVSSLPAGMYIVRAVTTTGEQLQSKFIKQ